MLVARSLGCSTITFRNQALPEALSTIRSLGFTEVDLGAIPAVVDHVPVPIDDEALHYVKGVVIESELSVRTVNADPGPLSEPELDEVVLAATVTRLCLLAATFEAALIVPCGAASTEPLRGLEDDLRLVAHRLRLISDIARLHGVRLLVEAPHLFRLCNTIDRADALLELVDGSVAGLVFDVSHVVASRASPADWARKIVDRIEHVHLRDASPGNINLSIGNGTVDFAALIGTLSVCGYRGHYSLELETHDIEHRDRPAATLRARDHISALIAAQS